MDIVVRRKASRPAAGVTIAESKVNLASLSASLSEALERSIRSEGFTLFTLNLDHLVKLKSNQDFRAAYGRVDLVSADGWPVVWLARRLGMPLRRACGSDMVEPLCQAAAERGLGLYFIGPGAIAQKVAIDRLRRRYPGLEVAGAETPVFSGHFGPPAPETFDIDALAERINASAARLCFVSMGAPKQELLADALAVRCPNVGFLCVGAALDFISSEVRRAPVWMQRANLEWFWRLASDPYRLGGRYAQCAVRLVQLAVPVMLGKRWERAAGAT